VVYSRSRAQSRAQPIAPSRTSLLQYASLRGSHALHASSLSTLPRSLLRHEPRWSIPRTRHHLEFLVYRLATLGRPAHATRGNPPLTVTLPNKQRTEVPEAVVRWSRGQEFAVENVLIEQYNHVRLQLRELLGSRTGEDEPISADSHKREAKSLLKAVSRKHPRETDPPSLGGNGVRF